MKSRLLTPPVVFLLLVLAGYSAFSLSPTAQRKLGFPFSGIWFLDSYAVLAASDAVTAGLDPFLPNPLDATQRPHSYSSWWFKLGTLGLTRQDNPLVGGLWVFFFFVAVFALLRPRDTGAALCCALLVLSPPVLLAVLRANNDLVVFALLAAGLLALRVATPWRLALFAVLLAMATGLKFYPLVAGLALVMVRPPRRMLTAATLTLLVGGGTLISVWADLKRAVFPAPDGVYTFGAPVIFHDLGWSPRLAMIMGGLLLAGAAAVCVWRGWFVRLDDERTDWRERFAFACGAALLVGCFVAGISHAYRLLFGLFLVPLLWRVAARGPMRLLLAALWIDGLYCLAANFPLNPPGLSEFLQQPLCWRVVSQPVIWAGMALLAGSLLALVRSTLTDTWRAFRPAS